MQQRFRSAFLRRAAACAFAFALALCLPGSALAVGPEDVPDAPANGYVYDGAEVLSPETEAALAASGKELEASHQTQIVVMTLASIPGSDPTERVTFGDLVIRKWNIGGDSKRGLLLLLSVDDGDYWAVAGESLKPLLTNSALKALLDDNLESSFAAGDYDAGVTRFCAAAAETIKPYLEAQPTASPTVSEPPVSSVPAVTEPDPEAPPESADPAPEVSAAPEPPEEGLPALTLAGLIALGVLAAVLLLVFFSRLHSRKKRRRKLAAGGRRSSAPVTFTPRHLNGETRRRR